MNGHKYKKDSQVIDLPVPAEGCQVGQPYAKGGIFGFWQRTVKAEDAEGEWAALDRTGLFRCETAATGDISIGDAIYFDAAAEPQFSNASGRLVGYAAIENTGGVVDDVVLAGGATGEVIVDVLILPLTTAAEAIEDAGGPDA